MGDQTEDSLTPSTAPTPAVTVASRAPPVREDCWSEEATATLVDAWGRRYLELNRGNLRQKDWQDVADAVNALHGHSKKTHRTDVQCKNRIDTIKKKYKVEKARVEASDGTLTSTWPFYDRLDSLIGSAAALKKPSTSPSQRYASPPRLQSAPTPSRFSPPLALPLPYKKSWTPTAVVTPVTLPQKRRTPDEGFFRRNYSAVAAAAAAMDSEDEEEEAEEEDGRVASEGEEFGMRRLAKAIERFGKLYERVEAEKLTQMVELERQRMQFAKDLEEQRMRMFMETQLERIKRNKHSSSSDIL